MDINFETHSSGHGYHAKVVTKSGNLLLSIIAGAYFYSEPREDLDNSSEYTAVELAIFDVKTNTWATKKQMAPAFTIIGQGEHEYNSSLTEPSNGVWGWVPVEKIAELYEAL